MILVKVSSPEDPFRKQHLQVVVVGMQVLAVLLNKCLQKYGYFDDRHPQMMLKNVIIMMILAMTMM